MWHMNCVFFHVYLWRFLEILTSTFAVYFTTLLYASIFFSLKNKNTVPMISGFWWIMPIFQKSCCCENSHTTRFIPLAGTLKRGTFSPIFGVCVEKVSQQGYVFFLLLVCVCPTKSVPPKTRGVDKFGGILDWWKFKFLFILNGIEVEAT